MQAGIWRTMQNTRRCRGIEACGVSFDSSFGEFGHGETGRYFVKNITVQVFNGLIRALNGCHSGGQQMKSERCVALKIYFKVKS